MRPTTATSILTIIPRVTVSSSKKYLHWANPADFTLTDEQFADSWDHPDEQECSDTFPSEESAQTHFCESNAISDDLWHAITAAGETVGTEEEDDSIEHFAIEGRDAIVSRNDPSQEANEKHNRKDSSVSTPLGPEDRVALPVHAVEHSSTEHAKEHENDSLTVKTSDAKETNKDTLTESHDLTPSSALNEQSEDNNPTNQTSQDSDPLLSSVLSKREDKGKGKAKVIDPSPNSLNDDDDRDGNPPPKPSSPTRTATLDPQKRQTPLPESNPSHTDTDTAESDHPQLQTWKQQYRNLTGHDFYPFPSLSPSYSSPFSPSSHPFPKYFSQNNLHLIPPFPQRAAPSPTHDEDEAEAEDKEGDIVITIDAKTGQTIIKIPWRAAAAEDEFRRLGGSYSDEIGQGQAGSSSAPRIPTLAKGAGMRVREKRGSHSHSHSHSLDENHGGDENGGGGGGVVPLTEIFFFGDEDDDNEEEGKEVGGGATGGEGKGRDIKGSCCEIVRSVGDVVVERWTEEVF